MTAHLSREQQQFNVAMDKYEKIYGYQLTGHVVSFVNTTLQAVLAVLAFQQSIGPLKHVLTFAAAYVLADFINGLVHMYMDNNSDYESLAGPLVASFHLHHKTPRYKQKPAVVVYYHESGSKIWLAFFLSLAVAGVWQGVISGVAAYGALYFSILSSIAEVSHYFCHSPQPKIVRFLGKARILLPIRHHMRHHFEDNINYAFLNGMTDPFLNVISKAMCRGYKNTTDLHYAMYTGVGTSNR
ncbi:MAG: hypothetical protein JXO49_00545 [Deltaproteobacteria bacterium]|nr:hypothetical protein [Candidatus Anaeroferrophillus wilburensis]MBN2887813.1 hypothetical protein [Deltaproteobacteria bacterium]